MRINQLLLATLLFVCNHENSSCLAQEKVRYSLTVNLNNSFLNYSGINDYTGFKPSPIQFGFGLGSLVQWNFAPKFHLTGGLLYDYSGSNYGYYNNYTKERGAKIHFPLSVKFELPSLSKNHFYLELGSNILWSTSKSTSISMNEQENNEVPEHAYFSGTNTKSGLFPQLLVGVGWRCITPRNRTIEYSFIYHQGFMPVSETTLKRFDSNVTSTFVAKNTMIKFQVNWFFKHKSERKNKEKSKEKRLAD